MCCVIYVIYNTCTGNVKVIGEAISFIFKTHSLYFKAAINKSNALPKKREISGILDCHMPLTKPL